MYEILLRQSLTLASDRFLSSVITQSRSACSPLPSLIHHGVKNDGMGGRRGLPSTLFLLMVIVIVVIESLDAAHRRGQCLPARRNRVHHGNGCPVQCNASCVFVRRVWILVVPFSKRMDLYNNDSMVFRSDASLLELLCLKDLL